MKNRCYLTLRELDNVVNVGVNDYSMENLESGLYNKTKIVHPFSNRFLTFIDAITQNITNGYTYSFITNNSINEDAQKMINEVFLNYQLYLCVGTESLSYYDLLLESEPFVNKLLNTLNEVYPRYSKLLNLYDTNKNTLIGKLNSITRGETETSSSHTDSHNNSSNSKSLFKDTPESSIVVSSDAYNSNATYNSGGDSGSSNGSASSEGSSTTSTSYDKDIIMNQINEVQEKYRNLLKDFVNEFRGLFWEVSNYE